MLGPPRTPNDHSWACTVRVTIRTSRTALAYRSCFTNFLLIALLPGRGGPAECNFGARSRAAGPPPPPPLPPPPPPGRRPGAGPRGRGAPRAAGRGAPPPPLSCLIGGEN